MKKFNLILFVMVMSSIIMSFAPAKKSFNYQAVITDKAGKPLVSIELKVRVSIVSNNKDGVPVYSETHDVKTSKEGIVTLRIGNGNVLLGNFERIVWSDATYFIRIEIDIENSGYILFGASELCFVPMAIYALESGNSIKSYRDLSDLPILSPVATSGSYYDLSNKPNLDLFLKTEADPLFIKSVAAQIKASDTIRWSKPSSFNGSYTDLLDKPNLSKYLTAETDPKYLLSVASKIKASDTTRWSSKSNFSGNYSDLSNKPNLSGYLIAEADPKYLLSVASKIKASDTTRWSSKSNFSGNYSDLSNKPNLSGYLTAETDPKYLLSVASKIKAADTTRWSSKSNFSGNYSDLYNKPNLSGYLTAETDPKYLLSVASKIKASDTTRWSSKSNFSGNYSDLSNKPNLSGYLIAETDPKYLLSVASKIKASDTTRWSSKSNFSGNYNDLLNKPIINTPITYTAGTGINIENTVISNTLPDQIVTLSAGEGIEITGTYPDFAIKSVVTASSESQHLTSDNYSSLILNSGEKVIVDGTISLAQNLNYYSQSDLEFKKGMIVGNGNVFSTGNNCTFTNMTFDGVDIDCNQNVFYQCSFLNNCPRLGYDCKFINCKFNGVVTSSTYLVGTLLNCDITNCTIPRIENIINSNISGCQIGNGDINANKISCITNCKLSNTIVYALQYDFVFSNNRASTTKIIIGNSSISAKKVTITNNQFSDIKSGETSILEIFPIYLGYKIFIIQGNSFSLQPSDPQSINISCNDGNTSGYSILSCQNNVFYKGIKSLNYSSNMKVNYGGNTHLSTSAPTSTGVLVVNNNVTL